MPEIVERVVTLTNLPGYILPREACRDLAQDDSKDPSIFRMRVLLLTPGTWNDIDFTADEIKGGVKFQSLFSWMFRSKRSLFVILS